MKPLYSFVGYSGGNITHWSFLNDSGPRVDRLCSELLLIADQDEGKDARHERLKAKLGDHFVLLPVKEVENLLPPISLRAVLERYGEAIPGEFDPQPKDYAGMALGDYLDAQVAKFPGGSKRRGYYGEASGTVTANSDFAETAIAAIIDWSLMTEEAQSVTRRMYQFVKDRNP